jgi:hypothetical protein
LVRACVTVPVGFPLELEAKTMGALLIFLVFVLYDAQVASEMRVGVRTR